MNSSNDNIYAVSGVALDTNVRVRALGRGALLKRKLHFSPQIDRNWKPINAFPMRLGRQIQAASVLELVPSIGIFA